MFRSPDTPPTWRRWAETLVDVADAILTAEPPEETVTGRPMHGPRRRGQPPVPTPDPFAAHPHRRPARVARTRRTGRPVVREQPCLSPVRPRAGRAD